MKTKIFDNTTISVCLKEITSMNLIEIISQNYNISTTEEVFDETSLGFNSKKIQAAFELINVHKLKGQLYDDLLYWLENRFPYLHKGELSSFLLAILEYEMKGKEYCFITDDRKMRETVEKKILSEKFFISKFRNRQINFNLTGTIGLLIKLKEKNVISNKEIKKIKENLERGTFYLSSDLLNKLMR